MLMALSTIKKCATGLQTVKTVKLEHTTFHTLHYTKLRCSVLSSGVCSAVKCNLLYV